MKKILIIVLIAIIFLTILLGYIFYINSDEIYKYYSYILELNIPRNSEIIEIDTHGGFNGDGETYTEIYISTENLNNIVSEVSKNSNWKKMPITEEFKSLFSNPIDERINIPIDVQGYYFFLDRHLGVQNKYDYSKIFERSSYNYSVAIFDIRSNIIYYYALDT